MSSTLVIVESPSKTKKISKILGSGFIVKASVGHIRDLKPISQELSINISAGFEPSYAISRDKQGIVSDLKKTVANCAKVFIATDDDREGEAIGWHLIKALGLPLDTPSVKFKEITTAAIKEGMSNPGIIKMNQVFAQEARRMVDRLVGAEISPVLWNKVEGVKSAGRVQSPTTRIVVEREEEISNHQFTYNYKASAYGDKDGVDFKASFEKIFSEEQSAIDAFLEIGKSPLIVQDIKTEPTKTNPPKPFITSSFQSAASSKLGIRPKDAMNIAQSLFGNGDITYLRTDSPALAQEAIDEAQAIITKEFGAEYSTPKQFKAKGGAQEAHEAIRPTHLDIESVEGGKLNQKIYTLIRNQTLASQMSAAEFDKTKIVFDVAGYKAITEGKVVTFDGFTKIMGVPTDAILPKFDVNEENIPTKFTAKQSFKKPKSRFTEASLIIELERLGIGRPSTYASLMDTIQSRGYVVVGDTEGSKVKVVIITLKNGEVTKTSAYEKFGADKGKLLPTKNGYTLINFMREYFEEIIDYEYTKKLEDRFDEINNGSISRTVYMQDFYDGFHPTVENAMANAKNQGGAISGELLGRCPETDAEILFFNSGKYGPYIKILTSKPKFCSIPAHIAEISIDIALELLSLPRVLGELDGEEVIAAYGKNGPYLRKGKDYINLKEGEFPESIGAECALKKFESLKVANAQNPVCVKCGSPTKIVSGRYGDFLSCTNYPKCKAKQPKIL